MSKISGAKEDQHDLLKETALTIGKILSYCNKNTEDLNSMAVRDEVMLPKLAAINDLYVPPGLVTNSTTFCHALFIGDHCKTKKVRFQHTVFLKKVVENLGALPCCCNNQYRRKSGKQFSYLRTPKIRFGFQQTQSRSLRQLFLTLSWDP